MVQENGRVEVNPGIILGTNTMPSLLFYVIMAPLLAWWTTRLARNKGRSMPWVWGLAAFLLTMPPEPWRLVGMVPLFILIFLKAPQPRLDSPPRESTCPKCQASHSASQRYCISCGWEIGRAYPEGGVSSQEPAETVEAGQTVTDAPEPVLASEATQTAEVPAETTPAPEAVAVPEPEVPAHRGIPTAPGMTERGIRMFNLGRTEEAIDQFTKAIALDADHKEAWERRAEAYASLGRDGEAEEDRRRLNAINPSSSTG